MLIYVITYIIFLFFSTFEIYKKLDKKVQNLFYLILFIFLVFQMGLRWETGTDWNSYIDNFNETINIENVILNVLLGIEIGYGFLVFAFKQFSNNYSIFLLIHAIIFYLFIFNSFKKYSNFPILSLLLFYSLTIGLLGSSRQLLALSICIFSIRYIINRNYKLFFVLIFFAFLLHTSALFFSIAYFLYKDINKYLILLLLLFAILIGFTTLPSMAFNYFGSFIGESARIKSEFYFDKINYSEQKLSIFGLIRRILYFIIFFFVYKRISVKYIYYKLFFNLYTIGIIFYFLFANSLLILVNRGSVYFNLMECFLLSSLLICCKQKYQIVIMLLLLYFMSIVNFYQSISAYPDLFLPYKGIIINSEFSRSMY